MASGFALLAGTRLEAELAVPGAWFNRRLQEVAATGRLRPITAVSVAFLPENRAVLLLAVDRFPLPRRIELPMTLHAESPQPAEGVLELGLEPTGLLRVALPLLAPWLRADGVSLDGNILRLRLASLPGAAPIRPIFERFSQLRWSSATGVLTMTCTFAVEGRSDA